jgi:hypothetical protein
MKARNNSTLRALTSAIVLVCCAAGVAAKELPCMDRCAVAVGNLYLCRSEQNSPAEQFACLRYRTGDRSYVLLYQGGPAPRAIRGDNGDSNRSNERWLSAHERATSRYEALRPDLVPRAAQYRGTGVCRDGNYNPLPCSLFEYAGARQVEAVRYFVFYEPDGSGIRRVDALSAGQNEHALEAELSHHLGQALTKSGCCRHEARGWLAHAVALFPDDPHYRAALSNLDTLSADRD